MAESTTNTLRSVRPEERILLVHKANNICCMPAVLDGLTIETHRKGQPGKLQFRSIQDEALTIEEGDIVQWKLGDTGIFQGIVFSRQLDRDGILSVTAYDQLRYLKNKQIYSSVGKTATEIIRELAADFQLTYGDLADTGYVIPRLRAGEQTLFDLMQTALDITTENTGSLYVLYDDCGKLTLKHQDDMQVDILIDGETAQNYTFRSDIDRDTYNQIVLYHDNKDTQKRELWIDQDSDNMKKWGTLRLTQSVNPDKPINLVELVKSKLKYHNRIRKSLTIRGAIGDDRIRGGSSLWLSLPIDNQQVQMRILVESVQHTYANHEHWMDLTLRGGEYL